MCPNTLRGRITFLHRGVMPEHIMALPVNVLKMAVQDDDDV